ncbi:MAG: C10 family peptidase [Bacteroidales bacterium]|nr:C10 family peptidase [Bacteroidales bacterium]
MNNIAMKHIVYTILFAILAAQAFSQDVDEKTARVVAERFFLKNYGHKASVENVIVKQYKGHESIYYCNLDRGGWVAVPANRNLNPVVAHSDEGSVDLSEAPQVFLDWMEQYEFVADVAREQKWNKEDRHEKWEELLSDDFDEQNVLKSYINYTELTSSKWGQSFPNYGGNYVLGYNSWMPTSSSCDNGRCPAGCVAVAIGQIMNYWGYSTGDYSDFNWWTMHDSLDTRHSNYDIEQASVSYLLKRIGDRTSMNYCRDGDCSSGTDTQEYAPYALENFGYKDDMDYKRKALHTYNQWVNILKTEILAERPVLYCYIGRHSFLCDGYDSSNDNFHFNFGWNGDCDMWVDFEDIDNYNCQYCSEYSSLIKHACIVNIRPNVSSAISLTNKTISTPSSATWPTNTTYQAKS